MPVYVDIPTEYENMVEGSGHRNASFFDFVAVRRLNKIKTKKTHKINCAKYKYE